jgi:hypothetical protein
VSVVNAYGLSELNFLIFCTTRGYYTAIYEMTVSENRVLKKIFGPKRDEVTGEWRKLHVECLGLYCLPDRQGMWHVWGKRKVHRRFWWGILTERDNSDMGVDRWNI